MKNLDQFIDRDSSIDIVNESIIPQELYQQWQDGFDFTYYIEIHVEGNYELGSKESKAAR